MAEPIRQQLIISGVGGQGVLFVTRLLAETAITKKLPVYTSETHGMAQRGGTVLSHLKVGDFSSPLIRPAQADGLMVLKAENLIQHGAFLRPGGWVVVNGQDGAMPDSPIVPETVDADRLAQEAGKPKSVNLIVLGFVLGKAEATSNKKNKLFCSFQDVHALLEMRFSKDKKMLDASLEALKAGYHQAGKG